MSNTIGTTAAAVGREITSADDPDFLDTSVAYLRHPPVIHDKGTKMSPERLLEVRNALVGGSIDRAAFPELTDVQIGQPHYRSLYSASGNHIGKYFRFMALDMDDVVVLNEKDNGLLDMFYQLRNHVHGEYNSEDKYWISGFNRYRHWLLNNRDGKATAFTMGVSAYNDWMIQPSVNATSMRTDTVLQGSDADRDPAVPSKAEFDSWFQKYNSLLGDFSGRVMRAVMNESYVNICNERKVAYNTPCYGSTPRSQSFFTTSQMNCSTPDVQLQGTAADVHADEMDCPMSYSLSMNLSVIRSSTSLGYFWFPDYNALVPVKPNQILIFSGKEQHKGTPISTNPDDHSTLPHNYPEEVRYNIINYPKRGIIDDEYHRNWGWHSNAAPHPNLFEDGLNSFGGASNYDVWRNREAYKIEVKRISAYQVYRRGGFRLDARRFQAAIKFGNTPQKDWVQDLNEVQLVSDHKALDARLAKLINLLQRNRKRPFSHAMGAPKPIDLDHAREIEVSARQLEMEMRNAMPSGVSGGLNSNVADDSGESSNQQPRQPLVEDLKFSQGTKRKWDERIETIPEDFEEAGGFDAEPEVDRLSDDEYDPEDNDPTEYICLETLSNFDLWQPEVWKDELLSKANDSTTAHGRQNLALFDVTGHNDVEIQALPVVKDDVIQVPVDLAPDFAIAYSNVLGQLQYKKDAMRSIDRGVSAAFSILAFEAIDQVHSNWDVLFREGRDSFSLREGTFAFKLKLRVDALLTLITGNNREIPEPDRLFKAADLIPEGRYDSNWHTDVLVEIKESTAPNLRTLPARLLTQIMWSMFLIRPLKAWRYQWTKQSSKVEDVVKIYPDKGISQFQEQTCRRLSLSQSICEAFGELTNLSPDIFLYLPQVHQFVWKWRASRTRLDISSISAIRELILAEGQPIADQAATIAVYSSNKFSTSYFTRNRGKKAIEMILTPPAQQNKASTRARVTKHRGPKKPTDYKFYVQLPITLTPEEINHVHFQNTSLSSNPVTKSLVEMVLNIFQVCRKDQLLFHRTRSPHAIFDYLNREASGWSEFEETYIRRLHDLGIRQKRKDPPKANAPHPKDSKRNGDIFNGIRLCGDSFVQAKPILSRYLSEEETPLTQERILEFCRMLFILRVVGFGRPDFIRRLPQCTSLSGFNQTRMEYVAEEMSRRNERTPYQLSSARTYGQLQVRHRDFDDLIQKVYTQTPILAAFLFEHQSQLGVNRPKPSFAEVQSLIANQKISMFGSRDLLSWLTTCDLAEYGLCEYPTITDLVRRVRQGGGTGPCLGLAIASHRVDKSYTEDWWKDEANAEAAMILKDAHDVLTSMLSDQWKALTGRVYTIADTEHMLCKISRMNKWWKPVERN